MCSRITSLIMRPYNVQTVTLTLYTQYDTTDLGAVNDVKKSKISFKF